MAGFTACWVGEIVNGDEDSVRHALRTEVALLNEAAIFTVIEFGGDGIIGWEVRQDATKAPRATHWPAVPLSDWPDPGILYERKLRPLITGKRLLTVFSAPYEQYADVFGVLRSARPEAAVYHCTVPLATLLRDVIASTPLALCYELVVLRQFRSGRLMLDGCQLFEPGAERGRRCQFRIRCETADSRGTVFAVVARESRHFRLVSVQSAAVDPGRYELTAVLVRPGHVEFQGLHRKLRADQRSWSELVSAVPARLDHTPPTHLVCVIEASGSAGQLRNRIDQIEQLLNHTDSEIGQLGVSLISYGPHSFSRGVPDEPATVLTWAADTPTALAALARIRDRKPTVGEYPRAAQLECALTEVTRRLAERDGRPALVVAGSRPPFPPRVDLHTEILPCPYRNDWRQCLRRLSEFPGITMSALRDGESASEIWERLGWSALDPTDVVDVRRLAAELGLYRTVVPVPFPLIDVDGG